MIIKFHQDPTFQIFYLLYYTLLIFQVKENWKLVLASLMLVLVGMGLIAAGICVSVIPVPNVEQIVFYVSGAICFIPGKYDCKPIFMYL